MVVREQLGPGMRDQAIVEINDECLEQDFLIVNMHNMHKYVINVQNIQNMQNMQNMPV